MWVVPPVRSGIFDSRATAPSSLASPGRAPLGAPVVPEVRMMDLVV